MKKNRIRDFLVEKDGFYGHLYCPKEDKFKNMAVIFLGGSGMPYKSTLDAAEAFSRMGIAALAVGYYGVPGTPKTIVKVPIEFVEKAVKRLHSMGVETVIAAGISKGAELALVAASLIPQINGVIAFSPSARVNMGIGKGISWVNASSWTFRGKELPYAYVKSSGIQALWTTICARELTFKSVYEKANQSAGEDCFIPVEKINGPILLAAASVDSLWPSAKACDEIMKRLDENNFSQSHRQLIYKYASHLLLPFDNNYGRMFRIGRRYPKECRNTIYELRHEVITFLTAKTFDD